MRKGALLAHDHAWLGTAVGLDQKNVTATGTCGQDHAFRHAEAHLPWRQICHHHGQLADQCVRIVGGLDTREDRALLATQIEGQFEQLVSAGDRAGCDDAGDLQFYPGEIINADGCC